MKRISELEYIDLIDELDSEKKTLTGGEAERIRDKMSNITYYTRKVISFKKEFDNNYLINFDGNSIEIDKFNSLYTVSVLRGKKKSIIGLEDKFYTFKNLNQIIDNLEHLTK
jgi:hypothetical protein